MLKVLVNHLIRGQFVESVRILGACGKHVGSGRVKVNVCQVSDTPLSPRLFTKVHDLLRSSSALDGLRRLGEDGSAALELLTNLIHLLCKLVRVHRANGALVVDEAFGSARDQIEAEPHTSCHNKEVILDDVARLFSHDPVVLGIVAANILLHPSDILWHK